MSSTLNHLRKMKRRLDTNSSNPHTAPMSPTEKIEMLEKTLSTFQSEVDMKLKIIQQILTTRNAQVTVQKKLLDREQNLYNALLAHWLNTPNLAASGVSMHFSDITENLENQLDPDFEYEQEDLEPTNVPTDPAAGPYVKPSRKSRRKRMKVTKVDQAGPIGETVDVDPLNVLENESSDDGGGDEEWCPSVNVEMKAEGEENDGNEFEHGNGKSYGNIRSCRRHIKTHTETHACQICWKSFLRKDTMQLHVRTQHKSN